MDEAKLRSFFGEQLIDQHEFSFGFCGVSHLSPKGMCILMRLLRIMNNRPEESSSTWLIPFRSDIRDIEILHDEHLLGYLACATRNRELLRLVVWLRGRCKGNLGAKRIFDRFLNIHLEDVQLRRLFVKTLAKMHAWPELQSICSVEHDERILRLAENAKPSGYRRRRKGFVTKVAELPPARCSQEFYMSDSCEISDSRLLKSASYIRRILERIRFWVRGIPHGNGEYGNR